MSYKNLKRKVLSGLVWTFSERVMAQAVSFIISLILARLLSPNEYGVIAIVMIFINIANIFVENGFGESLVQKNDTDETDFSTMFYCSLTFSIILYVLLCIIAPFIAKFYNNNDITIILRILALKIPISSISTIQHAYVSKKMIFKKFFLSTLFGTIISGIVGIIMAYIGFGIWALVWQYLLNTIIDTIVLFLIIEWKPQLVFSRNSAKSMVSYGYKVMLSSLINQIYNESTSLIIGKKYTSLDLAYYNRGSSFPSLIINNIDTAIGKVIFPAMSNCKGNKYEIKVIAKRSMKITSYLIFPLMVGLFVIAKPLVEILLTSKWEKCVIYLQIMCIFKATQPIQTTNWQIIKATGRGDLCIKLELFKKGIGIILLLFVMNISVKAIAVSSIVLGIISMVINMLPSNELISYTFREQIMDILPSFLLSIVMGIILFPISNLEISNYLIVSIQIIIGIIVYFGLSYILKIDSFMYCLELVKKGKNIKYEEKMDII